MLILAAEEYDVPLQHVVPTFVAFVRRTEPLTEAEVALFSIGTIVRIARAREEFLRKGVGRSEAIAKRIVCDIWGLPQEEERRPRKPCWLPGS